MRKMSKAWGKRMGKEKNMKNGEIYRICGRWIVATWLDLSPVVSQIWNFERMIRLTEHHSSIPKYEASK